MNITAKQIIELALKRVMITYGHNSRRNQPWVALTVPALPISVSMRHTLEMILLLRSTSRLGKRLGGNNMTDDKEYSGLLEED